MRRPVQLKNGCPVHPWRRAHKIRPNATACRICVVAWNVNHPEEKIRWRRRKK